MSTSDEILTRFNIIETAGQKQATEEGEVKDGVPADEKKGEEHAPKSAEPGAESSETEESQKENNESTDGDKSPDGEETEKTLTRYFDEDENLPKKSMNVPEGKIQDGDFSEEGEQVVIRAKHLADDINEILNENAGLLITLRKRNPDKAKVISKALGFVRRNGEADVDGAVSFVRAVMDAENDDQAKEVFESQLNERIYDWIQDGIDFSDKDAPIRFDVQEGESQKNEKKVSESIPYVQSDIEGAIEAEIGKSGSKVSVKEVMDSPAFFSEMELNKDPRTGSVVDVKQVVQKAFVKLYKPEPVAKQKTQSIGTARGESIDSTPGNKNSELSIVMKNDAVQKNKDAQKILSKFF